MAKAPKKTQVCTKCGKRKKLEDYYLVHGYRRRACKTCQVASAVARQKANPERQKAAHKRWRTAHPDLWEAALKRSRSTYYRKHRDKVLAAQRARYHARKQESQS